MKATEETWSKSRVARSRATAYSRLRTNIRVKHPQQTTQWIADSVGLPRTTLASLLRGRMSFTVADAFAARHGGVFSDIRDRLLLISQKSKRGICVRRNTGKRVRRERSIRHVIPCALPVVHPGKPLWA